MLELTEHDRIDDYELFGQAASELRSHGVRLAVDDAGAGFSSFRHILNLRPDIIKLDIGLTRGIDGDPARRALGSAMLAFGLDAFGAAIVAEGIETEGEFKTLRGLGCRFGQGYYLGRPGKLKLPRPQFDSAQHPLPAGEGETQPTLVTKAVGADSDSGSRHPSGMQPRRGRLLAPDGSPLRSDSRADGVSEPDERPRDAQDELLALVAELEVRPRDANARWTGDRSRVRLFR